MKRSRRSTHGAGLSALYGRLDQVRMTSADRTYAKAALAQADAVASGLLALADFARRLAGARPLHHGSAQG